MTIAEQIHTIVSNLPQEQASKILSFAEIVHSSYLGNNPPTSDESKETDWQKLVYDLAGSWGEGFPSLEEIRTNSEDITWDTIYQGKLAELPREVQIGLDASAKGEVIDGNELFDRLQTKLRESLP